MNKMINRFKFRIWKTETKEWVDLGSRPILYKESFISDCYLESNYFIVQQTTSLFDKNGKEIYEGDIVQWSHGFDDGERIFVSEVKYPQYCVEQDDEYIYTPYEERTIIGNICENPELLKL